jgi:hypothetical protein
MNLARFNIDCKYVAWREQVRLPIVQFADDARLVFLPSMFGMLKRHALFFSDTMP